MKKSVLWLMIFLLCVSVIGGISCDDYFEPRRAAAEAWKEAGNRLEGDIEIKIFPENPFTSEEWEIILNPDPDIEFNEITYELYCEDIFIATYVSSPIKVIAPDEEGSFRWMCT